MIFKTRSRGPRRRLSGKDRFHQPGVFDAQQVLIVPQAGLVRKLGDVTADQLALVEG
jgi:hypothetical protein